MNIIRKWLEEARKQYKLKEENKTTIELMYITRAVRKGQANGAN